MNLVMNVLYVVLSDLHISFLWQKINIFNIGRSQAEGRVTEKGTQIKKNVSGRGWVCGFASKVTKHDYNTELEFYLKFK